jgi:hypothetical protein
MLHHLDDLVVLAPLTADERVAIQRRGTQMRRRRHALQIGIPATLAAVAVTVAALIGGTNPNAGPEPITSTTPTPSSTGRPVTPDPRGPFEAVTVRGTTLVAVDAQGHERVVRDLSLPPLGLSAADLEFPRISSTGWLSLSKARPAGSVDITFVNVLDPRSQLVVVTGKFDIRTWSPDGIHLAVTDYGGCGACRNYTDPSTGKTTQLSGGAAVTVIDARTGARSKVDIHGGAVPGGGPRVVWTDDGSGVVVWSSDGKHLLVAPVAGGPVQNDVPALWYDGGARYLTPDGAQFDGAGLVAPDGTTSSLYHGEVTGATVAGDGTLSRDGRSAFVLLKTADQKSLLVARVDPGARPTVVATLGADTTTSNAFLEAAPDDSILLVSTMGNGKNDLLHRYVVSVDGGPAHQVDGTIVGWLPASVVNAIATTP